MFLLNSLQGDPIYFATFAKNIFRGFIIILFMVCGITNDQQSTEDLLKIEDFESYEPGVLPDDWHKRRKSDLDEYTVQSDSNENYISAYTDGTDMMIIKEIEVDIVKYPYFNWRWRVNKLPTNGDESIKEVCDAPASVALVTGFSKLIPKSIKYTWSTTLQAGTVTKSPFAFWPSRTDIIVLETGDSLKGQWISEKRNILEDYKMLYGKKKVKSKKIKAIAIMSDSDNTRSTSAADYDNFFFSKN